MPWGNGQWVAQLWGLSALRLAIMLLVGSGKGAEGLMPKGGQSRWRSAGRHCDRAWLGVYDSCRVSQGSPSFLRLRAPASWTGSAGSMPLLAKWSSLLPLARSVSIKT